VNLVRKEERRGPKTWPKGTNRDKRDLSEGVQRSRRDRAQIDLRERERGKERAPVQIQVV
jgi:hypothetical protein